MNASAAHQLRNARPRGLFALAGSYVGDLRGWVAGIAAGYGIAAALMFGGILSVFGAITVGAVALFHFIELRYGTNVAFAALAGGLLALALLLFVAGWLVLQRHAPPLPRPRKQARAAKQMLMGSTISRAVTALRGNEVARPDATTQILLGAAAVVAMGWLAASHIGTNAGRSEGRR